MERNLDNNPYESPEANLVQEDDGARSPTKLLGFSGRLGRTNFFCYAMLTPMAYMMVMSFIGGLLSAAGLESFIQSFRSAGSFSEGSATMTIVIAFIVVIYLPMIVVYISFMKRRLNDCGRSGWLGLLSIVPLLNILLSLYVLFMPGDKFTNQYGLQPEKASGISKFFVGFVIVLILLVMALSIIRT